MARPTDGPRKRSVVIHLRVTDTEKAAIDAQRGPLSVSQFIRSAIHKQLGTGQNRRQP